MCEREHHRRIMALLGSMDAALLASLQCWFGGGTAVALLLDEYRESVDVDFLCSDLPSYRRLRERVFEDGTLVGLFNTPPTFLRDVRADQYGVRTVVQVDGVPVKFEVIVEGRIALGEGRAGLLPVPVLAESDLFAEKLLANADRWADRSTLSRDAIDLLMMESCWGPIPTVAWRKVEAVYGRSAREAWLRARRLLAGDAAYLERCLERMAVSAAARRVVRTALAADR